MIKTVTVGNYYKSHLQGHGNCHIKVLPNSLLCVSEKPYAIFSMNGHISVNGTIPSTGTEFDDAFRKVSFQLSILKNT